MREKYIRLCFTAVFLMMIFLPALLTDFSAGGISESENRALHTFPAVADGSGIRDAAFTRGFEDWFNDHVGLRNRMVGAYAWLHYRFFGTVPGNAALAIGPNGEFNYVTDEIYRSYQHLDLLSEDRLMRIAEGFREADAYLKEQGIRFLYVQCWDTQSIYPERFPAGVVSHGDVSKTDQLVRTLTEHTDVQVVSLKQTMLDGKADYEMYGRWGDLSHWTQRGAYMGYRQIMDAINAGSDQKYPVLTEDDYVISVADQGQTRFGVIHTPELLEDFRIASPGAVYTQEAPQWTSDIAVNSVRILRNDQVDNRDTLLIIGDSYIDYYLYDDFGESFHKVVQIWGNHADKLREAVELYRPAVVLMENAERCFRAEEFAEAVLSQQ